MWKTVSVFPTGRSNNEARVQAMAYSHIRLRKFNTAKTYPEQKLDNDLSMSVRAGNFIFLRGQVGQTLDGGNVGVGNATVQTEQAMRNVKQLLEEQGARLADICKINIYITDPRYREAVYRVIGKRLKGVYPVSTGLVVQALARPEWLVEVDVFAVIPDKRMNAIAAPDDALQWKDTADRADKRRPASKTAKRGRK
jgi:enamine deaminase RidA (YjgF/YER057c/UK114 family)